MTEHEYLSWTRPTAILKCLGARATQHQCLLFLVACWGRRPEMQTNQAFRQALDLGGKVILGEAGLDELNGVASFDPYFRHVNGVGLFDLCFRHVLEGARVYPESLIHYVYQGDRAEKLAQANLLRCILGNPYTPAGADPAWLRWDNGAVPRMAEAIHRDRRFEDLPVLADALEEAGCDDSDILGHCRTRREHALGCWVLSLLRSRLAVRLVLSTPEIRLSGWRPDTAELENISAEPVTIAYQNGPFDQLSLLTLDELGEVVQDEPPPFGEGAWSPTQTIALGPGGVLRHRLGPTRTLRPGIYTMQALYRHGGIDHRSRAFLFTVPTQA
jgi:hypothetical protein